MSKKDSIKVGILGFGTVGSGVYKVLTENKDAIAEKSGRKIEVKKIAEVRPTDLHKGLVTKDATDVVSDPEISVVIETIGGVGPARYFVLQAIKNGKHVVTSNKELIAKFGAEIFKAAKEKGVGVLFEGAVGGGIPILWNLRECLAANQINEVYGIVNGTTNYILSKMTEEGVEFEVALRQAREKGFAEANPKMDIDGLDAAYKAVILASVAFGVDVDPKKIYVEGISKITQEDISYAAEIGYVIKLLAVVKSLGKKVEVRVHPTLVPMVHPLASVDGPFNAIYVKGDAVGELMFYGRGAGSLPTASAVVGDVINITKHCCGFPVSIPSKKIELASMEEISSRYYVRLTAADRHGVLSGISGVFAGEEVSIQTVVQKENVGKNATIVIIIHSVKEKNLNRAIAKIKKLSVVKEVCNVIRVGI
ncbi:MAG: homoserine dehydrogenase [Candidatus Saganbacteria bacterium]|nr:homoserine dehydrogenase [Candidatus Saganbacteria bacterium]